ncbi:MAG: ComF family protein [Gammaproteobacteria bacterium]|jgi:ComF family protein|nr:ComF family protein [Gammaproteobacteria bacterium]
MVNSVGNRLLNLLLPSTCALCGLPSRQDLPLCSGCKSDLHRNTVSCVACAIPLPPSAARSTPQRCGRCLQQPPPFSRACVPWLYDAQLAYLIHRWKFNGERHLSRLFAGLWTEATWLTDRADVVVPVPLHWRRHWQRGYNQAELLARGVCHHQPQLGPVDCQLLKRSRRTGTQSSMNAEQRKANLKTAFTALRPCDNLHIALVDDVMTTGATAASAATALLDAGARRVDLWCLARTPAPNL